MNRPRISVLIPTYNRAPLLKEVLSSLKKQSLPKDQFEVIVIDDGSSDNTPKVASSFHEYISLHYAYQENQGISVAKNHAIRLSQAPIVLFMDDDDIADKHLLAEHLKSHETYPEENIAVLGFTSLDENVSASPLMYFVTQIGYYLFNYSTIKHGDMLNYTYFWGGRSSCKKSLLLTYGVFDPVFRFGTEDIELGYRLSAHGLKVVYNQNAHTTMIRTISLNDFCKRVEQQGYSNWIFSQKHPVLEVKLWADVIDIHERWNLLKPQIEIFKKRASKLEEIVQAHTKYGIEIDDLLLSLLHTSYWDVIAGMRLQGAWRAYENEKKTLFSQKTNSELLEKIYTERPKFHYWDNAWQDGGMSNEMLQVCTKYASVANKNGPVIIETGAGLSTLAFLASGARKVFSIATDHSLKDRMFAWCDKAGLPTENLNFIVEHSEVALPSIVLQGNAFVDMVLIDGGHGWPTVFVDFCYGNYALKKGGIIAIDDNHLYSVNELVNFLIAQDGFMFLESIYNKLFFFRKEYETRLLPDWGGQPYIKSKKDKK